MGDGGLLAGARRVWVNLSGVPVTFGTDGIEVVISARSLLCPPRWAGIVVLGGAGIATAPTDATADMLRRALAGVPALAATDPERLRPAVPIADMLGPAALAYLDHTNFCPAHHVGGVEELPTGHGDLAAFLAGVDPDDARECGLADITSAAFVAREADTVVAAAGYRAWPGSVAHMGVLTTPRRRGRGLARVVASAAVADALAHRLLPQGRARRDPSRRVAGALGFRQLSSQLSIRIDA